MVGWLDRLARWAFYDSDDGMTGAGFCEIKETDIVCCCMYFLAGYFLVGLWLDT